MKQDHYNLEIHQNLKRWNEKPLLKKIYLRFYSLIASQMSEGIDGYKVELGSGIGNLKMVIPGVIATDMFANPWIDKVENAYQLSFGNESVSDLILFDVFHHLEYPGTALDEFCRVLKKKGRVIIFEPGMSLMGLIVYGLMHHEPVALFNKIKWKFGHGTDPVTLGYYSAQGNANRIFGKKKYAHLLSDWKIVNIQKRSSIAYVLSGGYSRKQWYPDSWLPLLTGLERILDLVPCLFATRMIVVLEKQ